MLPPTDDPVCAPARHPVRRAVGLACAATLLAACSAPLPYVARDPGLDAARAGFAARRLDDTALTAFLAQAGASVPGDGQPWDFDTLALVAAWHSDDVAAARVRWMSALERQRSGPPPQLTGLDLLLDPHTVTDALRPQPWTLGLGLEWLLPSERRLAARQGVLDSAELQARIELAQAIWRVRVRVREPWSAALELDAQLALAASTLALDGERARRIDVRVRHGEAAAADAVAARLAQAQAQTALEQLERQRDASHAALRAALGLPADGPAVPLQRAGGGVPLLPAAAAQQAAALDNRLDLRAAEARFQAADADLRWEVAQQYPDMLLKPGYEWDQGDHRLRIGLSLPLALPRAHRPQVEQAQAEREARARELQGRQVAVIQELALARRAVGDAVAERAELQQLVVLAEQAWQLSLRAEALGETDPLQSSVAAQAVLAQRRQLALADHDLARRVAALEDAVQRPLHELVQIARASGAPTAAREEAQP
ncbi:MAG: TolC family protein [Pseudomonadota bacterium]|nr:TolC family protein [Pseudomonadota bacterium]